MLVLSLVFRVTVKHFCKCLFTRIDLQLGFVPITTGDCPDLEPAIRPLPTSKNMPLMDSSREGSV